MTIYKQGTDGVHYGKKKTLVFGETQQGGSNA